MLHILWLILKCILTVLGILLGILLLAVFLVLFCPVRYRAEVRKEQPDWKLTEGEAGVSWLFHGLSFKVRRTNGENAFSFRILGISMDKFLKKKKEEPEKTDKPKKNRKSRRQKKAEKAFVERELSQDKAEAPECTETNDPQEAGENSKSKAEPGNHPAETGTAANIRAEGKENTENTAPTEKSGLFRRLPDRLTEIRSKISNIGLTFHTIHDKIEWWKKFIHHPRTKEAASLVWKHGKFLIRHILPTKVEGQVVFGCENPAVTGQLLGVLGMTIPFHKNCVAVTPLFDGENRMEGTIKLRGRIYGIVLLRAAIVIYFNKNVKYVIRRVKRRNHKEG